MSKYNITFDIKEDVQKLHSLLISEFSEDKTERYQVELSKSEESLRITVHAKDLASMRAMGNKVLNLLAVSNKADELLKE